MTETRQLRHLAKVIAGATPASGNPDFWNGDIAWITPEDVSRVSDGYWLRKTRRQITQEGFGACGTSMVPKGAVVLTKRAPIGQLAAVAVEACCNQGCFLLDAYEHCEARFLYYYLTTQVAYLQALGRGSTFMELATDDLKALSVSITSRDKQEKIANYLDRETAKIDAMIAAKERLLKLLAEKRRALITHAVTRGLNPDAPMRDSGVEWLGEIPEHWEIYRLKMLVSGIEQGWSPQCFSYPADDDSWGVVKAGCCNGGVFNSNDNKLLPPDLEPPLGLELRPGDVLMSRASGSRELIGSVAMVPEGTRSKLLLSDKTYRLALRSDLVEPRLFVMIMGSLVGRYQITAVISGAEGLANNVGQGDIKEFIVPLPSMPEQREIIANVQRQLDASYALSSSTQETIDLLAERRQAIISLAVTGVIEGEVA